ncbi:MAG: nucleoside kinase [Eubacteriales bacterium]|nr:nucleoside kinase [Eubacteriales bacterium]
MFKISYRGITNCYHEGTAWKDVAVDFQKYYKDEILLVHSISGNHLFELNKMIKKDAEVEFVTYRDKAGRMTYARSAILILLKAFYEIAGSEHIDKIQVEFTIGGNFYIVPKLDFELDEEFLIRVKEKMEELVSKNIPFTKKSMHVDDAIESFKKHGMTDKSELFKYRRSSSVNVYELDGFEDYFYGAMCASTAYIRVFDLIKYQKGFVLILPDSDDPERLAAFNPSDKLFKVQSESCDWADRIGIGNIADLNDAICKGRANDLIIMQEAFFEKKIGEIAQRISKKDKKIILIAGPSSSGKTTTANRLAFQLMAYGINPHIISADDYFIDYDKRPVDENGKPDLESLSAVDTEQFNADMLDLLSGQTVEMPKYNFKTGKREYKGRFLKLEEDDVLIIEGIHCLNDKFSEKLPNESKYRIYVSALTQLNIDEHNRIPTTDCRLLRRMVRDNRTRGHSAKQTIASWPSVRAGEEKNIFPYQDNADVLFNTSMIYELAVLKTSAEPLLFDIDKNDPEYLEAKRLLKFLDYVLSVSPEIIPKTSVIREFIGGSCLDVG